MKHLGYEAMRKATDKLSAVSKTTLMPLLGKLNTGNEWELSLCHLPWPRKN
jgi:hypothetical protein